MLKENMQHSTAWSEAKTMDYIPKTWVQFSLRHISKRVTNCMQNFTGPKAFIYHRYLNHLTREYTRQLQLKPG